MTQVYVDETSTPHTRYEPKRVSTPVQLFRGVIAAGLVLYGGYELRGDDASVSTVDSPMTDSTHEHVENDSLNPRTAQRSGLEKRVDELDLTHEAF
jgi:hypothetical protein